MGELERLLNERGIQTAAAPTAAAPKAAVAPTATGMQCRFSDHRCQFQSDYYLKIRRGGKRWELREEKRPLKFKKGDWVNVRDAYGEWDDDMKLILDVYKGDEKGGWRRPYAVATLRGNSSQTDFYAKRISGWPN